MRFPVLVPGFDIFDLPGYWFGNTGFEKILSSWLNQEVSALLLVQTRKFLV
jgi:hypothetical protein